MQAISFYYAAMFRSEQLHWDKLLSSFDVRQTLVSGNALRRLGHRLHCQEQWLLFPHSVQSAVRAPSSCYPLRDHFIT